MARRRATRHIVWSTNPPAGGPSALREAYPSRQLRLSRSSRALDAPVRRQWFQTVRPYQKYTRVSRASRVRAWTIPVSTLRAGGSAATKSLSVLEAEWTDGVVRRGRKWIGPGHIAARRGCIWALNLDGLWREAAPAPECYGLTAVLAAFPLAKLLLSVHGPPAQVTSRQVVESPATISSDVPRCLPRRYEV